MGLTVQNLLHISIIILLAFCNLSANSEENAKEKVPPVIETVSTMNDENVTSTTLPKASTDATTKTVSIMSSSDDNVTSTALRSTSTAASTKTVSTTSASEDNVTSTTTRSTSTVPSTEAVSTTSTSGNTLTSTALPSTSTAAAASTEAINGTDSGPSGNNNGTNEAEKPMTVEETEEAMELLKSFLAAQQQSEDKVPFGKLCNTDESCQDYPSVQCVINSLRVATCRCSFLATLAPGATKPSDKHVCILNVLSPCSNGPGEPDSECTANAVCANDTLGMSNTRYCRCIKRFKPAPNEEKFPAFCVPDGTIDEVTGDYEYGRAAPPISHNFTVLVGFVGGAMFLAYDAFGLAH